jgi:hypothetical protein
MAGQPTVILDLRMDVAGRITATEMRTAQPLAEVPLEQAIGEVLRALPPVLAAPPAGRSVWERLRDPWPLYEPPRPENLLSPAELAAFSRWDPSAELEEFTRWDPFAETAGPTA